MRILIVVCEGMPVYVRQCEILEKLLTKRGHRVVFLMVPWLAFDVNMVRGFDFDAIIGVNVTRLDCPGLPEGVRFVTWLQDEAANLLQPGYVERWNERGRNYGDRIFGFTGMLERKGYDKSLLFDGPMLLDINVCHASRMVPEKHCDVFFAGNRGHDVEEYVKDCELYRISKKSAEKFICSLKKEIKKKRFTKRSVLELVKEKVSEYSNLGAYDREFALTQFFWWRIHECVFRQQNLKELLLRGYSVRVCGDGWERNSSVTFFWKRKKKLLRFGKFENGQSLYDSYRSADYSLHLNGQGGYHYRPWEIVFSGGEVVSTWKPKNTCGKLEYLVHYRRFEENLELFITEKECPVMPKDEKLFRLPYNMEILSNV